MKNDSVIEIAFSGKWEVSFLVLKDNGSRYKVTRRIPELDVSETKLFKTRKKAEEQFKEWLNY